MTEQEKATLVSSLQSLNTLRDAAEKNSNRIVTCHLNRFGRWDMEWYIRGSPINEYGLADNIEPTELVEQLERLATDQKPA